MIPSPTTTPSLFPATVNATRDADTALSISRGCRRAAALLRRVDRHCEGAIRRTEALEFKMAAKRSLRMRRELRTALGEVVEATLDACNTEEGVRLWAQYDASVAATLQRRSDNEVEVNAELFLRREKTAMLCKTRRATLEERLRLACGTTQAGRCFSLERRAFALNKRCAHTLRMRHRSVARLIRLLRLELRARVRFVHDEFRARFECGQNTLDGTPGDRSALHAAKKRALDSLRVHYSLPTGDMSQLRARHNDWLQMQRSLCTAANAKLDIENMPDKCLLPPPPETSLNVQVPDNMPEPVFLPKGAKKGKGAESVAKTIAPTAAASR